MNSRLLMAVFISALVILTGCTEPRGPSITMKVNRIFMHESNNFTFLVQHENGVIGQLILTTVQPVIIQNDVPDNEQPWIRFSCWSESRRYNCKLIPKNFLKWQIGCCQTLAIHIHRVDEIAGAGWDHGKFGSGQTVVIE